MPIDFTKRYGGTAPEAAPAPSGVDFTARRSFEPSAAPVDDVAPEPEETSGFLDNPLGVAAGAAGVLGAGYLAKKLHTSPSSLKSGAGKALEYLNAARMTSMLSGLAPVKSALGGVGAVLQEGAERGQLRKFVSEASPRKLYTDYKAAMKAPVNPAYGVSNPIGNRMGALDTAFQEALKRGGLTAEEAERAMMQAPLDGKLGKALDSPVARYLVPFRRTPINQVIEGFEQLKPKALASHPIMAAGTAATGAVHGAATSEDRYPTSIGLGTAAAGKRGVLYALGALAGRTAAGGGEGSGIAQTMTPVSDFGIEQAISHPIKSLNPSNSAAANLLRKLGLLPE